MPAAGQIKPKISTNPLEMIPGAATSTATAPINTTGNMTNELEALIPGFSKNLATASGNISELLSGLPTPALARNAAAYYGVTSGIPGSDYIRNKGFDLYNTQANQMKQQGQDDLLKLLSTVSGTAVATPGQALQEGQFTRNLGQQESQFGRNLAQQANQFGQTMGFEQQQWQKQLELLDKYLGGAYGGGSPVGAGYGNVFGQGGQPPNAGDYSKYTNTYAPDFSQSASPFGNGQWYDPLTGRIAAPSPGGGFNVTKNTNPSRGGTIFGRG